MSKVKILTYITAIFMISCNHLEEGVVVGKEYQPARTYVMLLPLVISTGKSTSTIMTPHTVYDGEDYILKVEGEKEGEIAHEYVYVTKECYTSLSKGDLWIKSNDCSFHDKNNSKREN